MIKYFASFFNFLENSSERDLMNSSFSSNNVDNFKFFQKDTLIGKNNRFIDEDKKIEKQDDFPSFTTKNFISNYDEQNFENIFSFENEPKETVNHIFIENDKKDEISKKFEDIFNFSGENNNRDNSNELNFLNYKDYSLKDINNNISCTSDILDEPEIEINISKEISENIIDNNINKRLDNTKIKLQKLEINYSKKFQLFNKGTNNQYVNEIINSINNKKKPKKKRRKKLFKTNIFENGQNAKLIGRKRKNKRKKR